MHIAETKRVEARPEIYNFRRTLFSTSAEVCLQGWCRKEAHQSTIGQLLRAAVSTLRLDPPETCNRRLLMRVHALMCVYKR